MSYSIKYVVFLGFISCWMLPRLAFTQEVNQAIEPIVEGSNVIDLLHGGTLDAWKVPSNRWSLEEGIIIGDTGKEKLDTAEWIYTNQEFGDFEFTCEVKLTGEESRNTGVYFRVNTFLFKQKRGNKSYEAPSGYEFDVAYHKPEKKNFQGSLGDWYARPSLRVFADENILNQVYKSGKWNRLTIRARANRIEYWLNGYKIMDFLDEDPKASRKGIIGFQIHDGAVMKVAYRNILARELNPVPSYLKGYEATYAENPRAAAIEWFKEAEFGMFIHYGLYSLMEGYSGEIHSKPAEWVQLRAKIRPAEYEKLTSKFTAENFDADFITDLAVDAGMKYINITTRHHDGFCLFDSEYTEFKSTNSAAKRDLIAELAEQCQKKDLGLFFYYSHGRDWKHPHSPNREEWGGNPKPDYEPQEESYKYGAEQDLQLYVEYMKNQITELLTNYGPVAGIWLDGRAVPNSRPEKIQELKIQELYDHIHSLQPQVLVSYKQGVLGTEDFKAPERNFTGESDVPLEICNTMQPYAWGYDRDNDVGHKTADEVMEMLSHTKQMKANLLLNIGPLPDGSVFRDDIITLKEVGKRLATMKK